MKNLVLILLSFFLFSPINAQMYRGAELRTHESFTYGRFETRYKAAWGTGVLSNFFTYNDFTECCDEWNEIDFELLGRYGNDVQTTTITPGQRIHNSHEHLNFSPTDSFYTYAFEWTPDYVAWFVDGEEIYRQTGEHISTLIHNQKMMMNIWAAEWESWVGEWNVELLPFFAYYDWAAYYEYKPGTGDYGTDNNFTLSWRDEFDSYDSDRWGMGTHTFPGNKVLFTTDNVVYKDGMMILCLTDDTNLGYQDKAAPKFLWARVSGSSITAQFTEKVNALDAVEIGKYSITPAKTIQRIELQKDERTVKLFFDELDPDQNYNLIFFGIRDQFETPNTQTYDFINVINNPPLEFPLKINAGSDDPYKGFLADQVWNYDVEYGHMDGHHRKYYHDAVNDTENDSLYQALLEEVVQYKIRVPNGIYSLTLGFADMKYSEQGKRSFDIYVEDTLAIGNLDVVRDFGSKTAKEIEISNISVSDGMLNLYFDNWVSHPIINSIVVEQLATGLEKDKPVIPSKTHLKQNFPNPFNPETKIVFFLESPSFVELDIFDSGGRKIQRLLNTKKNSGRHELKFNSHNMSSGVYFYRLKSHSSNGLFTDYKKMLLLK
ncbi:MAG: glycosyl hydrolase family protein [Calditrichaeota bacterium]|nr:MAG: T9SS C-terminal target domain-containing protein [Calditrichota bacterium]MBL1205184.1 glycosyl hydrolase family protein [Calditrichota bacterium]NOG45014.1 family 16 glycosylhydrolase [Calditrichota bacterium]